MEAISFKFWILFFCVFEILMVRYLAHSLTVVDKSSANPFSNDEKNLHKLHIEKDSQFHAKKDEHKPSEVEFLLESELPPNSFDPFIQNDVVDLTSEEGVAADDREDEIDYLDIDTLEGDDNSSSNSTDDLNLLSLLTPYQEKDNVRKSRAKDVSYRKWRYKITDQKSKNSTIKTKSRGSSARTRNLNYRHRYTTPVRTRSGDRRRPRHRGRKLSLAERRRIAWSRRSQRGKSKGRREPSHHRGSDVVSTRRVVVSTKTETVETNIIPRYPSSSSNTGWKYEGSKPPSGPAVTPSSLGGSTGSIPWVEHYGRNRTTTTTTTRREYYGYYRSQLGFLCRKYIF